MKLKTLRNSAAIALATSIIAGAAAADPILIGVAAEPYPPFSEKSADGTWVGWEIEIMDAVCAAMEADCEIVEVAWDGIIPALLSERIDVIMASMSITEERMQTIAFSERYYNTPGVIVAPTSLAIDGSAESLEDVVMGIQVATVYTNYADVHYPDAEYRTYSTLDEHNQDLAAGRIDAVMADSIAMAAFLESDVGADYEIKVELVDEEIFGVGVGAGVRQGEDALRDRLNAAIAQIREDGTYDAISAEYFDFDIYGG